MDYDDINHLTVDLFDFLVEDLGCLLLDENKDYDALNDFLHKHLDAYITKERNYN